MSIHASYIHTLFVPSELKRVVRIVGKKINEDKKILNINSIAFRGMSGAVFCGALSVYTGLPIIIVRKNDESHSANKVELPNSGLLRYAFVDDFISVGTTLKECVKAISKESPLSELVKIYLYATGRSDSFHKVNDSEVPLCAFR